MSDMKSGDIVLVDDDERTRDETAIKISKLVKREVIPIDAPRFEEIDALLDKNPSLIIID
ncbi:unnamed protein product, partial [marine sediment metagenome]